MYSYEDRLRAVRLYIKLGKRVGLTIRQLGYPTKNALKGWYREYEQRKDLRAVCVRRSKYTKAQREAAVNHYLENGRSITATIQTLGYPSRGLLSIWIRGRCPEMRVLVARRSLKAPTAMKQSAVIALCMRQASAQAIAEEVGVSRPTLYTWKNQLLGSEDSSPMTRNRNPSTSSNRDELEQQVETLRRDIRRLQLEQNILKKANELLKKDLGVNPLLLTNREKTQLVDALRSTYKLAELLCVVGLARSSFFYHLARFQTADQYAEVRLVMADIFKRNYRCYGYRRMRASLGERSVNLSEKVVRRLMKQESLVPVAAKRRRYGSYMGEISPAPDNLLNRDFSASAPNEKWLTDITEFQIPAGEVYLSRMIGCHDGLVVSWSISTRPDAELVNTMLDTAIETVVGNLHRPLVHSDRGGHYDGLAGYPEWQRRS